MAHLLNLLGVRVFLLNAAQGDVIVQKLDRLVLLHEIPDRRVVQIYFVEAQIAILQKQVDLVNFVVN